MINKFQISNFKFQILVLVLGFGFLVFGFDQVYAQSLSLSISPPVLELIIKPGKSVTQMFKLTNNGDPVVLNISINELNSFGIVNNPKFIPEKWITLLNTDISLNSPFQLSKGEIRSFVFRISPSSGLPDGDLYRAIVISSKPNPIFDTSQSSFSQNLGIPLLISITATGELDRIGGISRFQIPQIVDSLGPINADIFVKNTGKSFFHPNGILSLSGPAGKANYSIIPGVILAGEEKHLTTVTNSSNNNHTISITGFFIGKYQLVADLKIDESNSRLTQSKTVLAIPIKLVGIIFFILIVFLNIRSRKKKK